MKGLTANSFVSISLLPPIVMISIQNGSIFLDSCVIGKRLGISILSTEQKNMSDHFAGMQKTDIPIKFLSNKKCHVLHNSLAWYETTIRDIIHAGDHHLILCDVEDLGRNENAEPLIYYSGYLSLGKDLA